MAQALTGTVEIAPRDLPANVRYAGTSGDFNPLHYDPAAAKRSGFERVLVHGSWMSAHVEQQLAGIWGQDYQSYSARFERPVMIGEPLRLEWQRDAEGIDGALYVGDELKIKARINGVGGNVDIPEDFEPQEPAYRWQVEEGARRQFLISTSEGVDTPTFMPLAFLGNAARWTSAKVSLVKRLGFAYDRMMHGSTSYELVGAPVRIGETYWVTEAHANRLEKAHRSGGTMRLADAVHEIRDEGGALKARITNRMIERPPRG